MNMLLHHQKKKWRTTFRSLINESEEDKEWTYLDEIKGRGREELDATTTQGSIEEELEPNLDQVINNIQIEPIVYVEPIVSIT
jgi:hypothetical protein